MAVKCSFRYVGNREFLVIGNDMIPIDKIIRIQTDNVPNGSCDNSVLIKLEGSEERLIWAYENADAIRSFLGTNGMIDKGEEDE